MKKNLYRMEVSSLVNLQNQRRNLIIVSLVLLIVTIYNYNITSISSILTLEPTTEENKDTSLTEQIWNKISNSTEKKDSKLEKPEKIKFVDFIKTKTLDFLSHNNKKSNNFLKNETTLFIVFIINFGLFLSFFFRVLGEYWAFFRKKNCVLFDKKPKASVSYFRNLVIIIFDIILPIIVGGFSCLLYSLKEETLRTWLIIFIITYFVIALITILIPIIFTIILICNGAKYIFTKRKKFLSKLRKIY